MTIWILTVVLLASLAGLGFRQGAIRVAFSFFGIVLGALLAGPLSHPLGRLLPMIGVKNPLLNWALPPLIVFVIVSIIFKAIALAVHQKVEVYYKYKAGDLHQALWERLNHRLGLCLGLVNGAAYLLLVCSLIYMISYWTVQTASSSDPWTLEIVNRLGNDLVSSRMSSVARKVGRMPESYYDSADIAGILYQNPLVEARFSRYPAFLGISERQEIQDLAHDANFMELRLKKASVLQLAEHPQMQKVLKTPGLVKSMQSAVVENMSDLTNYLATGQSQFDSEKLVGRWLFDLNGSIALYRKTKPTATPAQLTPIRNGMAARFGKGTFVATPEKQVFLRNIPRPGTTTADAPVIAGDWNKNGAKYDLSLNADGKTDQVTAEIEGSRVMISGAGLNLAFYREN